MQERFAAAYANKFITDEELDAIAKSPYSLMNKSVNWGDKSIEAMESYGIHRKFSEAYICHWKSHMVSAGVIDSSSLTFQEDDARIYMTLHYPTPVQTWNKWKTIYWFSMKMLAANDASALNLYRGVTDYPKLSGNKDAIDSKTFNLQLNHPSPGLSTVDRFFPPCNYAPEQFHRRETLFHLEVLKNTKDALKIEFGDGSCKVYPITLGADDQLINPGTFVDGGQLLGLEKPLSADDIRSIGMKNLGHHIATTNNYVTAVREYRATDLKGCMNSNVSTSFLSGSFKGDKCEKSLKKVTKWVNKCGNCHSLGYECCECEKIYNKCGNCERDGLNCVRMVVFNILWDMGSSHKSVAKNMKKIDCTSTDKEFVTTDLQSISFGGLHLCKCVVNAARCFNMVFKGEKFGVYILRSLRHGNDDCAKLLAQIKNAVLVCKDRQSDLLAYFTVCLLVQQALEVKDVYSVLRVPEKILHYTDQAKTQKPIILPVSIKLNKNGEVFLLDQGAACVHAYDLSDVARSYILGKYMEPCQTMDEVLTGKDIVFSDCLRAMDISNDHLYIADEGRNEVMILKNCANVKRLWSKHVYTINVTGCISLASHGDTLVLLCRRDDGYVIKGLHLSFPKSKSGNFLQHVETFCHNSSNSLKDVFSFNSNGFSFGARTDADVLLFYKVVDGSIVEINESVLKSSLTPSSSEGSIIVFDSSSLEVWNVDLSTELEFSPLRKVAAQSIPIALNIWEGKLINIAGYLNNEYFIEEIGQLDFAIQFCDAVMRFYHAIGYVPPHGDQSNRRMNIVEAITNGEVLSKLLSAMQLSQEEKYPKRKTFTRENGLPYTATIQCVQATVSAWKGVSERLNSIQPGLHLEVYPHAVANEYLVENSFGCTIRKGQGHNQNQMEYVQSKRKVSVNFQMDMCEKPFHHYTKVKVRDKGYQEINPALKSKVKLDDLCKLFQEDAKTVEDPVEVSPEDQDILHTAFLFSKSVPRQTNRCKWREQAEHTPNLLEEVHAGKLKVDDLVFYEMYDGSIVYFKVLKETLLINSTKNLDLVPLNQTSIQSVPIDKLMVHEGQIVAMPSYCYSEDNGVLDFVDVAKEMFSHILDQNRCTDPLTDEEWSVIFSSDGENTVIDTCAKKVVESGVKEKAKRKKERLYGESSSKKKKTCTDLSSKSVEDKLASTWEALIPPAEEDRLKESWIAFIYSPSKKNNQLIFGRLKTRFLYDSDGTHLELTKWDIDCCKPYRVDSGTGIVEEIPGGEKPYTTDIHDIIYYFPAEEGQITYNKSRQWLVTNIAEVVSVFKGCTKMDRKKVFVDHVQK